MKKKTLRIIPLGGLGEVGKNMTVYEYGGKMLLVDAGIMFPENDMIGIDYILPDAQYVLDNKDKLLGIVITHGHEDHIGALPHLLDQLDTTVYGTALTLALVENKLNRRRFNKTVRLQTIKAGESLQIGPFKLDFFHVCHSIPDGVGIGIDTPAGLVIHTGDFKFDHSPVDGWPTDYSKIAELSSRGVLALLSDSTNAEAKGWTPTERVMDPAFEKIFREAEARVIVATFASLVSRVQQIIDAAVLAGRKIAFAGTSMVDVMGIAKELGYLHYDERDIVPLDAALSMPDAQVVLVVTGSQGEPLSILGRLANGTNRRFNVKGGDTIVLSSQPIPGNELLVYRAIDKLLARGAKVIYNAIAPIHVSGHGSQEELKLMLHLVKPRYLIPVHGERHMLQQHANIAVDMGMDPRQVAVVENGRVIEFTHGEMKLGERIPGGYVFVDGSGVGDVDNSTMREREQLSNDGVVMVNLHLDEKDRYKQTQIVSRGFINDNEAEEIWMELKERLANVVGSRPEDLQRATFNSTRNLIYEETGRQPVIFVAVSKA
mgnify:FL=1